MFLSPCVYLFGRKDIHHQACADDNNIKIIEFTYMVRSLHLIEKIITIRECVDESSFDDRIFKINNASVVYCSERYENCHIK